MTTERRSFIAGGRGRPTNGENPMLDICLRKMPIAIRRFFIGYDTYERHRLVASLIDRQATGILDVGGSGVLAAFTHIPVTVTNLSEGDVHSNALYLPFAGGSFDVVTSLDVLEHIPRHDRPQFIKELMRVAKLQVVLCAPYGSPEHIRCEKRVLEELAKKGRSDSMLAEHVDYGLPTPQEVLKYLPDNLPRNIHFTGDFRFNRFLFKIEYLGGPASFRIIKALAALMLNLVGNLVVYPVCHSTKPRSFTNRMVVVAWKDE